MRSQQKLLLALAVFLVGGSLLWTAGYGLRLRSDGYRREVEADLSAFFELPCEVGRVRGQTFSSRDFERVVIWLPDRRDRVFSCERATWRELDGAGEERNELNIHSGVLALGTDRWAREDFQTILKSSLEHDFEDLHLVRVTLDGFEITFDRNKVSMRLKDTSGIIDMANPGDGIARLHAYELNGYRITQGVQIHARFVPRKGIRVSEFLLTFPRVPLSIIGLDAMIGGQDAKGHFSGSMQYVDREEGPEVWLRGDLEDIDLSEVTRGVRYGPLEGRFSVSVHAARLAQDTITHFKGRGRVEEFELGSICRLFGLEGLHGKASFDCDTIDVGLGRINRLRLSGSVGGVSLEEWLSPLGRGSATGRVGIRVNNVEIAEDSIKSADIEVIVLPPPDEPGTIDRELLLSAIKEILGLEWPAAVPQRLLPAKVEYVEFGLRLLVRDNQLRLLGTHGPEGDTILSIRAAGMTFGVVKEQPGSINLGPYMTNLRDRARQYDAERLRDLLQHYSVPPP